MLRRHEDRLKEKLEVLQAKGYVFVEFYELRLWHELERLGKSVWRDLRDRFDELSGRENSKISLIETENGVLVIDISRLTLLTDRIGE